MKLSKKFENLIQDTLFFLSEIKKNWVESHTFYKLWSSNFDEIAGHSNVKKKQFFSYDCYFIVIKIY